MSRLDNVVRADTPTELSGRAAGVEPLPGYRLLEPLGSGGFGEVWKCEVPGGLFKAIKFVPGSAQLQDGDDSPAEQELDALRRIKAIRHPFILSIERVEVVAGELLIITELADRSLQDVLADCRRQGQDGIPRDTLLGFLLEAAEALDVMTFQHGLQHLDVKPGNLFLVSGHVKVADFGLVNSPEEFLSGGSPRHKGITPLYAAPEVLQGGMSRHSDQYSLALVYQELLTGTLPFQGKNARQLLLQRLTADPDFLALPAGDRPVVARALSRDAEQRFASCLDFVQALLAVPDEPHTAGPIPSDPQGSPSPARSPAPPSSRTKALRLKKTSAISLVHPPAPELALSPVETAPAPPDATAREALPGAAGPATKAGGSAAPAAASAFSVLPGYKFLDCLGQGPLGEVWRVQGADGRDRLAQLLPVLAGGKAEAQARLHDRLGALRHPILEPTEVLRAPSGRVVVLTAAGRQTLRDRMQECLGDGLPGIPRAELLGYLGAAAEGLEALHRLFKLPHLGLCPRNVLVEGGKARLAEFGLIPLLWPPGGEPAGPLNPRYAAPELVRKGGDPASDQYSLALMYAEMLTGIHPRGKQRGARSLNAARLARLDLDLLPAPDREIVARALDPDPRGRFASCTEMVCALEEATAARKACESFPLVIPYSSLQGQPVPPDLVLPSAGQLVTDLIAAAEGPLEACRFGSSHYFLRPGPALEYRCPIRHVPAAMRLKLDGFRDRWKAQVVSADDASFVCRLKTSRSLWQRWVAGVTGLEVQLHVRQDARTEDHLAEATVRIQPFGDAGAEEAARLLEEAPRLLASLRSYLQTGAEQRAYERWPCTLPLQLWPVPPLPELVGEIAARTKDISVGGIGFLLPQPPPSDRVYLRLVTDAGPGVYAMLARVVRVQPLADGTFEVGAAFLTEESEADF